MVKIGMGVTTAGLVVAVVACGSAPAASAELLAPGGTDVLSRCSVFPTDQPCTDGIARIPGASGDVRVYVPRHAPAGPSRSGIDGRTVREHPGPGARSGN